jgi:osmoprotectant transport system substrate-binding protein
MRSTHSLRRIALLGVLALVLGACGSDADEGPDIVVASFNFPESEILGEIYAQALEGAGYPVTRQLNLGSRELIYPDLLGGSIDLLPEYLGSALMVWFGEQAPADVASGESALAAAFADDDVRVLTPAPAENNQAFVVSSAFADANGVSTISDLDDLGPLTFAGPPECEDRDTCHRGLVETYGLVDLEFQTIQEAAARLAALDAGTST